MSFLFLVFLTFLLEAHAFSGGAGSCDVPSASSMPAAPGSGSQAATKAGYGMNLPNSVGVNTPHEVTFNDDGNGFTGFLLHATSEETGLLVGSWSVGDDTNIKLKQCGAEASDSVTHAKRLTVAESQDLTLSVTFPEGTCGNIMFYWVFVVGRSAAGFEWYIEETSVPGPTCATVEPPAPEPTTADCVTYCSEMAQSCPEQYLDQNTCQGMCNDFPVGQTDDVGGNTFYCRAYHLSAASFYQSAGEEDDRLVHCAHAGPSGGGACGSWCESYCENIEQHCTGENEQYADTQQCLDLCANIDPATTVEAVTTTTSGNTLACRNYHLQVASTSDEAATVHCPHARSSGGDGVCGDLCEAYCDQMLGSVCGTENIFTDRGDCTTQCATLARDGTIGDTEGDTVQCRLYHAEVATFIDPADNNHCAHADIDSQISLTDTSPGPCFDPCVEFCAEIMLTCDTDAATQFASSQNCLDWCALRDTGTTEGGAASDGTHTLGCAIYHLGVATLQKDAGENANAAWHCAHAGPSGGGTCPTEPCVAYCEDQIETCPGNWPGIGGLDAMTHCMAVCQNFDSTGVVPGPSNMPAGYDSTAASTIPGEPTLACRIYHGSVANSDPSPGSGHCGHSSLTGTDGADNEICGGFCDAYCDIMENTCGDEIFQPGCDAWCAANIGDSGSNLFGADAASDTLDCRIYHAQVAALFGHLGDDANRALHCAHASQSGANVCSNTCELFCQGVMGNCTVNNAQYASQESCEAQCASWDPTTFQCRTDAHFANPLSSCQTAGPTGQGPADSCGGNVCDNYCHSIETACTGANVQFLDTASCLSYCAGPLTTGADDAETGAWGYDDTFDANLDIDCRFDVLETIWDPAGNTAAEFCTAAGPFGDNSVPTAQCGNAATNFQNLYESACPTKAQTYFGPSQTLGDGITAIAAMERGTGIETSGDTLACRFYHAGVALALSGTLGADNVHCDHAGADGAAVCAPQEPDCDAYCAIVADSDGACVTDYAATFANGREWCDAWCTGQAQLGSVTDTSGNTIGCRQYHAGVATSTDPAAWDHCAHASFSGGDVCGSYCDVYCDQIMGLCTDTNVQYADRAACMLFCEAFDDTLNFTAAVTSGPSLACRSYHLQVASTPASITGTRKRAHGPNAAVHCDHAGPFGGDGVCGTGCEAYCDVHVEACGIGGSNWVSKADCVSTCEANVADGTWKRDVFGITTGNSLDCRFYHAGVALTSGDTVHCDHSREDPTDFCVAPAVECTAANTFIIDVASKNDGFVGYPSGYTVDGELQPALCLQTGVDYCFEVENTCFHPFYISKTADSGGTGAAVDPITTADGLAAFSDTSVCGLKTLTWTPAAAGDFYSQCDFHSGMGFPIRVADSAPPATCDFCASGEQLVNDLCVEGTANTCNILQGGCSGSEQCVGGFCVAAATGAPPVAASTPDQAPSPPPGSNPAAPPGPSGSNPGPAASSDTATPPPPPENNGANNGANDDDDDKDKDTSPVLACALFLLSLA